MLKYTKISVHLSFLEKGNQHNVFTHVKSYCGYCMSEQGIGIGFTEGTGREGSGRGGKDKLAE